MLKLTHPTCSSFLPSTQHNIPRRQNSPSNQILNVTLWPSCFCRSEILKKSKNRLYLLLQVYWEANNNPAEEKDIKEEEWNKENVLSLVRREKVVWGCNVDVFLDVGLQWKTWSACSRTCSEESNDCETRKVPLCFPVLISECSMKCEVFYRHSQFIHVPFILPHTTEIRNYAFWQIL